MGKIKVIVKRPDEVYGHATSISDSLSNLQKTVDGHIEAVTISDQLVILCDEEGRLKGKPYNCTIEGVDFVGVIVAIGYKGEEFADVPLSFADWKELVDDGMRASMFSALYCTGMRNNKNERHK